VPRCTCTTRTEKYSRKLACNGTVAIGLGQLPPEQQEFHEVSFILISSHQYIQERAIRAIYVYVCIHVFVYTCMYVCIPESMCICMYMTFENVYLAHWLQARGLQSCAVDALKVLLRSPYALYPLHTWMRHVTSQWVTSHITTACHT